MVRVIRGQRGGRGHAYCGRNVQRMFHVLEPQSAVHQRPCVCGLVLRCRLTVLIFLMYIGFVLGK